ncbi:hypothetical protein TWF696_009413 [Orbilia brochopaga]|uniref:Secreted protein n=1 Tax=Orbilia brochopaga TaxID=3140254 RepID=A0AAV9UE94_9PEZI
MQLFSRLFAAVFAAFAVLFVFANAATLEERGRIVQVGRWNYNRGQLHVPVNVRGNWGNWGNQSPITLWHWNRRFGWQRGWCQRSRRDWVCNAGNVAPDSAFCVSYWDGRNQDWDPNYSTYYWVNGRRGGFNFGPPPFRGGKVETEEKPTTA